MNNPIEAEFCRLQKDNEADPEMYVDAAVWQADGGYRGAVITINCGAWTYWAESKEGVIIALRSAVEKDFINSENQKLLKQYKKWLKEND
jgi:hypothetical protein